MLLGSALTACGGGGGGGGGGNGAVNAAPTASATADPTIGGVPLAVSLDGSASRDTDGSIASYRWTFGDGSADATSATVDHTFDALGTYQVQLTVTDNDGATATTSVQVEVVDGDPPVAMASATPEAGQAPLTVDFSAAGSNDPDGLISLYQWDFGDGSNTSPGQSPSHTFQTAGSYDVTLQVVDDDGLSASTTLTIEVSPADNELPAAAFTASPESGPAPLAVDFDASGSSDPDGTIASYAWDFGDGSTADTPTVMHTFDDAGTYEVTLRVTDNAGGFTDATRSIYAGIRPVAAFSASPDTGTPSLTVEFDGSASSDSDGSVETYQWDFDDGDSATGASPTHVFEDVGEYQVSLTVIDDDGLPSEPVVHSISVTQDPDSLSFRDFFDTNTISQYETVTGAGQSVTYDGPNDRMRVVAADSWVEVSHSLPAEDEGFFQMRFLPNRADSTAAAFELFLEENDTTYYLVSGRVSVGAGEPVGEIRKVVNGATEAQADIPIKGLPQGYTNGLVYSINVYFSPSRLTAEFTELGPRVVSVNTGGSGTPIKVGRMRVRLDQQDAYLDSIIKEPISPDKLNYYIAFGDSITEGTGDDLTSDGRGFPIELQQRLLDDLVTTQVVFNEGFGGLRTADAVPLLSNVVARHPRGQFVAILIGTNDALQNTINANQYRNFLEQMLTTIRDAGMVPMIARLPHATPASDARIDAYNAEIDDLVSDPANADIVVVPPNFACYFDNNAGLINADQIHPTGLGYRAMGQLWHKLIELGQSATPTDACTLP